jgi:hypothetical protein
MRTKTRTLIVSALAPAIVVAGGTLWASPTVGVYDENVVQANVVDFNASGNSLTAAQFTTNVASAFASDLGGVINGSVLGSDYEYGAGMAKTLRLAFVDDTNVAIGAPTSPLALPISEIGAFASSASGGFDFTSIDFAEIINGLPFERVVEFGVTVLSSGQDFGTVRVTGRLAGGGTMIASRTITEPAGQGDTFFGLTAPADSYFTGFSLRYFGTPTNPLQWFDDIGFRTDVVVPEPASGLLLLSALVCAGLGRKRGGRTGRPRFA